MLPDAPPPAVFLLIPLLVTLPFALARRHVGGFLGAAACATATATLLSVAIGIRIAGYGPTGTSITAAFTLLQYLPLCALSLALWLRLGHALQRLKRAKPPR